METVYILTSSAKEKIIANISRAAVECRTYPEAWCRWKEWSDEFIPEGFWKTPKGKELRKLVIRNLQSLIFLHHFL